MITERERKMKSISLFSVITALAFAATCQNASAGTSTAYANAISGHNIGNIQSSIISDAMHSFSSSKTRDLLLSKPVAKIKKEQTKTAKTAKPKQDTFYGKMPTYGEYGDDGTIFATSGKSSGDNTNARAYINNLWFNWNHFNHNSIFDGAETSPASTDYDLLMFGMGIDTDADSNSNFSDLGLFGGHIGGSQKTDNFKIEESGGFIGLYKGYASGNFNISSAINAGALLNTAQNLSTSDDYTNTWMGAALQASYDYSVDDTFILQPSIYVGYTWVKSANYTSQNLETYNNDNLNSIDIIPKLSAIKHIGNGWIGSLNAKYAISDISGGQLKINNAKTASIQTGNYTEIGIGLEKSIERFTMSANINHRDGSNDGWNGGMQLKYAF